jgi:heme ABC exporter ATP-binding subunit CcmA
MTSPPVFSLATVGKRFGPRAVLQDVSFEVAEGDFLLLLGNNGAGKTTLMRILSTLMRPSQGEVHFRGQSLHQAGDQVRGALGMISHESRFYADLTAQENLRVFGRLYRVRGLRAKVAETLKEVRLDDVPDIPVRAFSSGMVKRLAIARLLLYRPGVLLLDEPYSGLDQASIGLLDEFLRRFRAEGGTTLMITHQFTAGVGLSNRIVILHQGRLVYNQPAGGVTPGLCADLLQQYGRGQAPAARS